MRIQFWGTRGSIPTPGPTTVRYGGNTSCVELVAADGTRLIFDCGTGAHALGANIMARDKKPSRGHILIGHTHWDHIQGLPFFAPLFSADNEWDIYAPQGLGAQLRETLAGQMQYTYFPVDLKDLGATIRYHDLIEGTFHIGNIKVVTQYLNHPALTLGYRVEIDGIVVVYATDHEPHARPLPASAAPMPGVSLRDHLHAEDRRHIAFLAGADLLIHDAQYTAEEYPAKVGYGHSTIDYVAGVAIEAGVRRLSLFHHDPLRTDDALDEIVASLRSCARPGLEIFAAAEGQVVELAEGKALPSAAIELRTAPTVDASAPAGLIWVAGEEVLGLAERALASIGCSIVSVDPTSTHLTTRAAAEQPSVLLLGRRGDRWDAITLCRTLRDPDADAGARAHHLAVVVISTVEEARDMALGFAAGVTDWCTRPCSVPFLRSRVRAWLLRNKPRWEPAPLPPGEPERLEALRSLNLLDTEPGDRFERIARVAVRSLGVPYAAIKLIDQERERPVGVYGGPAIEVPRDISICAHTILGDEALVISDAHTDARFGDNPAFHSEHRLRFYAGLPLRTPGGHAVGAICLVDRVPRRLDEEDLRAFRDIADLAERELVRREASAAAIDSTAV